MPATDEPIDVPTVPAVVTQLSPSVRDSAGTRSLTMRLPVANVGETVRPARTSKTPSRMRLSIDNRKNT